MDKVDKDMDKVDNTIHKSTTQYKENNT